MTTPSPGTRTRLVRLTHLLSSLDDRRRVNWADSTGSDLTAVKLVSPLPASAYIVSPDVSRPAASDDCDTRGRPDDRQRRRPGGVDSFTRAVQLAAAQRQPLQGANAPPASSQRDLSHDFEGAPRQPPPPVSLQPLPDTALPRLSQTETAAAPPSQRQPPPSIPDSRKSRVRPPRSPLRGAAAQPQSRAQATYNAAPPTVESAAESGASHSPTGALAAQFGDATAFTRALLQVLPGPRERGGPEPLASVRASSNESTGGRGEEAVVAAAAVQPGGLMRSRADASFSTISSAQTAETAPHSVSSEAMLLTRDPQQPQEQNQQQQQHPQPQPQQQQQRRQQLQPSLLQQQHSDSAFGSSRQLNPRSPPPLFSQHDRGSACVRTLRPASVLLAAARGGGESASAPHGAFASLTAFPDTLVGGFRNTSLDAAATATASGLLLGPRPVVRPLPAPPRPELFDDSDDGLLLEAATDAVVQLQSPQPWIPAGVGAAETKHRLVSSPSPSPAARASPSPSPSPGRRRHSIGDGDTALSPLRGRQVAQAIERGAPRGGAGPVSAVPPLPPPPTAASTIRAFLTAPPKPPEPELQASPARERRRPASAGPRSAPAHGIAVTSEAREWGASDTRSPDPALRDSRMERRENGALPQAPQELHPCMHEKPAQGLQSPLSPLLQPRPPKQAAISKRSFSPAVARAGPAVRLSSGPSASSAQVHDPAAARGDGVVNPRGRRGAQEHSAGESYPLHARTGKAAPAAASGVIPHKRPSSAAPATRASHRAAIVSPVATMMHAAATPERRTRSPGRLRAANSAPPTAVAPASTKSATDVVEFVRALVNLIGPAATAPKPESAKAIAGGVARASHSRKVAFALPTRLAAPPPAYPMTNARFKVVLEEPAEPNARSKRAWR